MTNYPTKKLGEVCEVIGGGTPSTSVSSYWDGDTVWVTPKDLGRISVEEIFDSGKKISQEGLDCSSAKLLPKGAVVLSTRAPIGYVSIAGVPLATNQGCRSFVCGREIYNKYLYHFLKNSTKVLQAGGSGSTFAEISGSRLKQIEIPLPPLETQKKIVAMLESLLGKINEAKKLRAEAQEKTENLLSAELHKIFSEGKEKGWEEKELGEISEIARGGSPRPIKDYITDNSEGINWIKIGDASKSTKYIYETRQKIKPEGLKKSRLVENGDLLLSNSMSFGRPYIMKVTGAIHDGWLVIKPNYKIVNEEYLYQVFGAPQINFFVNNLAGGAVVKNLNINKVKTIPIPLPPLSEQKKIVARLDSLSQKVDQLEKLQKTTETELTTLEQSILHKAFKGELV